MAESFGSVVVNGWRDGFVAIYRMPILFLTAFWLFLGEYIVARYFDPSNLWSGLSALDLLIRGALRSAFDAAIMTSVLIAVHRYVILREVQDRPVWQLPANYVRFGAWFLFLSLLQLLINVLLLPFTRETMIQFSLLRIVIYTVMLVIFIRSILLFPALAVNAGSARWRNAWVDSRGHFWRTFLSLATILVLQTVMLITAFLKYGITAMIGQIGSIVFLCSHLLSYSLAAAIASRLYLNYAHALVARVD